MEKAIFEKRVGCAESINFQTTLNYFLAAGSIFQKRVGCAQQDM